MIGIIDYGAGNLRSVGNALDHLQAAWELIAAPEDLAHCDRLILPGVGHFGPAMDRLGAAGMVAPLQAAVQQGKPLLGLCLGAQMLLEGSAEAPGKSGLGLIPGQCARLTTPTVPHMGWNRVHPARGAGLFDPEGREEYFYFAHSFVCAPAEAGDVAGTCACAGVDFCVAVERGRVFGVQFHPEKSATAGLALLRRFAAC
jgi:imidazole glycerol phosphate synthase glutamine amidotransferase subunit